MTIEKYHDQRDRARRKSYTSFFKNTFATCGIFESSTMAVKYSVLSILQLLDNDIVNDDKPFFRKPDVSAFLRISYRKFRSVFQQKLSIKWRETFSRISFHSTDIMKQLHRTPTRGWFLWKFRLMQIEPHTLRVSTQKCHFQRSNIPGDKELWNAQNQLSISEMGGGNWPLWLMSIRTPKISTLF